MSDDVPGEEKSIDEKVPHDPSAPEQGLEREDAQSSEPVERPTPTRRGMWSDGSPDTSGYGEISRTLYVPTDTARPWGGYFDAIGDRLAELVPDAWTMGVVTHGELTLYIPREKLTEVVATLRDDALLRFEMCASVSGVHYPLNAGAELHVVYHLQSMTHNRRLRLEVTCPDADPHVPSVCATYPAADWHERETWDMFGVIFDGHPALTRILMPDDWLGHPQRKDYPLGGIPIEYKGAVVPPPDQRREYR